MHAPTLPTELHLFGNYAGTSESWDEVFQASGEPRAHWTKFTNAAAHLTRDEFSRRWAQAQRLLRQNSLAYPDPRDPSSRKHPWELDAFPLVLAAEEWHVVSAALVQRATLLDLVLRDLYGPRKLISAGYLPAEAIFRHPGFLLPYCFMDKQPRRLLHLYAADLARSPDGRWWILADRCEAPSGAGFALENRIAISRMLPDVMHQCQVDRLAPYFIAMQRQMACLARHSDGPPRIVLLSRAAGTANYFEDAFLARYLGYTLAEAGDLAIRDNKVYLKTLAGLSPVDVLWRRPNSDQCDPLELSDSASIGVAGLLQAVRSGNVAIANGLGSGLVESPLFMAFLPQLCEVLLDEPLKAPGVATWWCGDEQSRNYVFSRIGEVMIRPAYRIRGQGYERTQQLAQMSKRQLISLIQSAPGDYVAQESVDRSTAPIWSDREVVRSYISLRAFVVADGDSYQVMPGGLTRVSTKLTSLELSLLDGESSKDTWVLAEGPVPPVTLLRMTGAPIELRRGGVDLPSRAAENFFWLGRHTVRAESLAKLLRAVAARLASEEQSHEKPELRVLLRVLALHGQIEPGFVVDEIRPQLPAIEKLLPISVFEDHQVGTLRTTVTKLVALASSVRDLMSLDSWRIVREMDVDFRPSVSNDGLLDVLERVDSLLVQLAAFGGYVAGSMTRTYAWRFLDLGRRLELALQTVDLIRTALGDHHSAEYSVLEALLEICDGLMTYRSRYSSRIELAPVLDLLLTDDSNPRAVIHQLIQCADHVEMLPDDPVQQGGRAEQSLVSSLLTLLRNTDSQQIAGAYMAGDTHQLEWLLKTVEDALPKLSNAITHKYFFHSGPTQRLAEISPH